MQKSKDFLKFLLIAQILILFSVYYIEYGMNVYACKLCKYQRVPYFLNTILIVFLIFNKVRFFNFIYVIIVSITINLGISLYHVGIERNIFTKNEVCTSISSPGNERDLLKELTEKNNNSCANVNFRLLKLSLSELNFLTNIVFLMICVHIIRNEKKNKN
tara:strand:- start:696 stop:1175 length:480 start_codon:yes stop_codon:yes gene_type:complete